MLVTRLIHPVILCGGSGTRLWPLSRQSYPKQFSSILGGESQFQETARRLNGEGFAAPLIVASAEFRFIVRDQLEAIGIAPAAILIEPEARNTAPAVLAATLWLEQQAPAQLMFVAPSDHHIPDETAFRGALFKAVKCAEGGAIVAFGVKPDRAETAYGYLEMDSLGAAGDSPVPVRSFVEKPDLAQAEDMVASGRHLWNAGMYLFRSDAMANAFASHAQDIHAAVNKAIAATRPDLSFMRLDCAAWTALPSVSLDYAIMEKVSGLRAMPLAPKWSDLGSWTNIRNESPQDAGGVATSGDVTAIDCRNCLLRSESDGLTLVGIGLEDIVAVAMPDAVLIARLADCQRVGDVVVTLRERKVSQADSFPQDHRPWGWFESLARGPRFQVKRIVVHPGASLSLQSHRHRSEHWVVVEGTARVTVGEQILHLSENQSVYIPLGEKHRLENPGQAPMVLIEVQTGSYLGEDDIIRYDDIYARQ